MFHLLLYLFGLLIGESDDSILPVPPVYNYFIKNNNSETYDKLDILNIYDKEIIKLVDP